jgi:hypothetical protein
MASRTGSRAVGGDNGAHHGVDELTRDERPQRSAAPAGRPAQEVRERQHERFGGFSWGSDFFGWLTAAGLTAILTGIASAAGAALALNEVGGSVSGSEAETIGLSGGIALLVILGLAYYCGGYVAGRMARFDGARQGVGVWIVGIVIALLVAALAAVAGNEFNVLDNLNLPRLPVDQGSLTTGGLIALATGLIVTLVAAITGGKVGERFHTKVDRVG